MEAGLRLPPPGGRFRPITILGSPGLKEVKMLYYSRRFFDADGFDVLPPSTVESCTDFLLQLSRVASDLTVLEVTFNGHVPPIGAALSSAVSTKTNLTAFTSAEVPLLPKGFVQLSRCPCLHTAIVSLRADDWVTDGNTVSPQLDRDVCFPTLLTLTMSLDNFNLCVPYKSFSLRSCPILR